MFYTIKQVADRFGLPAHTLRYYDKEGLLPFVSRDKNGNRLFSELDLNWIALICCLKNTGMPIKEIKEYSDWCKQGSQKLEERKALLIAHREQVEKQIEEFQKNLALIDTKIATYEDPELVKKMDEQATLALQQFSR
ncbi:MULTISPECIES: MerR family transcriptional regulator [Brevibacillus]|uniref:MerR family transcriptional regulator n=1 Tax=Brevibacillus TaxID=55080 RepID=UPI000D10A4B2|nr:MULTISPECIES: MerR family transcriptional regulator [Brevibacillus]MED1946926.1 MerR family transcriptional regulator [Brevibacillus formosus]MED2001099.1 MerR family transcriptional regulator [Brevibacillus formosus]MED2080389.1 MerR family transcriptional regulator [Brevibacillus formosus]PSK16119.1 MerR family transcriptional regulator [Brevibacillus sp. NRRL NRS-603]